MGDAVDCIVLGDDTLNLLVGNSVTLHASFPGQLTPVRRITSVRALPHLIPLLHHGAVVLVDVDFLLLVHEVPFNGFPYKKNYTHTNDDRQTIAVISFQEQEAVGGRLGSFPASENF